jgi:hypothetical protein
MDLGRPLQALRLCRPPPPANYPRNWRRGFSIAYNIVQYAEILLPALSLLCLYRIQHQAAGHANGRVEFYLNTDLPTDAFWHLMARTTSGAERILNNDMWVIKLMIEKPYKGPYDLPEAMIMQAVSYGDGASDKLPAFTARLLQPDAVDFEVL